MERLQNILSQPQESNTWEELIECLDNWSDYASLSAAVDYYLLAQLFSEISPQLERSPTQVKDSYFLENTSKLDEIHSCLWDNWLYSTIADTHSS